jgi:crotonobetainyl-CoA:carnitine CoA-transferase CaiB-like acyl-CoA transferase
MARTYDHPEVGLLTLPGSSLLFSQTKTQDVGPAPLLGQHTDAVLRGAGYDDAELADLRARKVIR